MKILVLYQRFTKQERLAWLSYFDGIVHDANEGSILVPAPETQSPQSAAGTAAAIAHTLEENCVYQPVANNRRFPFLEALRHHKVAGGQRLDTTHRGVVLPMLAHYDRIFEAYVLGFDHRCPFIGNVVGYDNLKYFILFLFYACVLSLFVIFNLLGCCGSSLALHLDITAHFDSGATYDDFELYDKELLEDLVENQEQVAVAAATR